MAHEGKHGYAASGNRRHEDVVEFAGNFNLSSIHLHNHKGESIDIKRLVQEFNIYESIYTHAVTGTAVITDAIDLIGTGPIQGTERISFKLSTPGVHDSDSIIDCSEETGHPMHIYKLGSRQQVKDGMIMYVLYFASREFLRNIRTRVNKSYSGRLDTMVNSILGDKQGLDTRKKITVQKTLNKDKIVIPNMKPFSAVNMLCNRALAENSDGKAGSIGYFFYETTKGFEFRSWESMCVDARGNPREVKQKFELKVMKTGDGTYDIRTNDDKILDTYNSVEKCVFINNFHDVAANTALGTYGHRVITHNIYNKSYKINDYHYHNQFGESKHTDGNHPAIVDTPVDWDTVDNANIGGTKQKGVSDYPESRVTLQPTTQFLHGDDTGHFGTDVTDDGNFEGSRVSQKNQVMAGTRIHLTIKGQSYLSAGDVIAFNFRRTDYRNKTGEYDRQYSGRYIITAIRHRTTNKQYTQHIECSKDSVFTPFERTHGSSFPADALRESAIFRETD